MGRIIDIQFNDKTYTIEHDRASVYAYFGNKLKQLENQDANIEDIKNEELVKKVMSSITLDDIVDIVYYGLQKHHKDDMPSKDELFGLIVVLPNLEGFFTEVVNSIKEVLSAIKEDKKGNATWGVRKN